MMVIKKYENGVRYKAELLPTHSCGNRSTESSTSPQYPSALG